MLATPPQAHPIAFPTMLEGIVGAICDRPGDTEAQRDARSRDVSDAIQGFEPRDPVELMLAGMAVTHAHLIQDSVRDLVREQDNRLRARGKTTIVALGRAMVAFLKELRIARKRTPAISEAAEPRPESAPAPTVASANPGTVKRNGQPSQPVSLRASTARPEPPVPLSPVLRTTEMSIAAMTAVLSPPTTPVVVPAGAAASPPRKDGAQSGSRVAVPGAGDLGVRPATI